MEYIKNPRLAAAAEVPAVSALYELQQRAAKQSEIQGMKAREATMRNPQSVAAKTVAKTAPMNAGVAGLDTGDMYNEQNFASGGIVAFGRGGNIDDVDVMPHADIKPLTNEELQILAAEYLGGADVGLSLIHI